MSGPPAYQPMPSYPEDPGTGGRPVVPQQVSQAAKALYGLAALQLVGLVIALFQTDTSRDNFLANDPTLSDSDVSTLVTIGLVVSSIVSLAFAGVWLLCARKVLAGRTWARILATVLAAVVIVLDVLALVGGAFADTGGILTTAAALVGMALAAAFLFFVWSRPASDFFAAAAAPR